MTAGGTGQQTLSVMAADFAEVGQCPIIPLKTRIMLDYAG
jgi:hypothetical protein